MHLLDASAPHNLLVVSCYCGCATTKQSHKENTMIEGYFSAPKTIRRLRAGLSGPFIDGFAEALQQQGYSRSMAIRSLHAASHIGWFIQRRGGVLSDINESTIEDFGRHLMRCRCYQRHSRKKTGYHARFAVKRFHRYLVKLGICAAPAINNNVTEPSLVTAFRDWFRTHRGVTEPTLRLYCRGAADLLRMLGEDFNLWSIQAVRKFLLDRSTQCSVDTTQQLITSMRAFLRFLSYRGYISTDLHLAVPAIAHWRLASLPQSLSSEELERVIATCDGNTIASLRNRAIILMLCRLGLRAGDLVKLCLDDIDWRSGTLQVTGKGRYQVRLPLPQDVGDALLKYINHRPRICTSDRVFLCIYAPIRPFATSDAICSVVKRALKRAGIQGPTGGAHLLRHTTATEMLRHGVPLDQIGLVLRHRSIDMTAYYAKVDIALMQQIAQPWPEVNP
jgi:site-specific recombinase XerD